MPRAWQFTSLGRELALGVGAILTVAAALGAGAGVVGTWWLGRRR